MVRLSRNQKMFGIGLGIGLLLLIRKTKGEKDEQEQIDRTKLTKDFSLWEFRQKNGNVQVPQMYIENARVLAKNLQVLRDYVNKPVNVSVYRTPEYNRSLPGAAKDSFHMKAFAADITIPGLTPVEVYSTIAFLIAIHVMTPGGIGWYKTHIHYDPRGTNVRWSKL